MGKMLTSLHPTAFKGRGAWSTTARKPEASCVVREDKGRGENKAGKRDRTHFPPTDLLSDVFWNPSGEDTLTDVRHRSRSNAHSARAHVASMTV